MTTISRILETLEYPPGPFVPQFFASTKPGADTGSWEPLDTLAHLRQLKTPKAQFDTLEDAIGAIDSLRDPINEVSRDVTRYRVVERQTVVWSSHRPNDPWTPVA